ncbi:MAG TPA: permease-like cell division protein FtsX [Solirubrobacteraceae bacterium]|nr:permease-like cell division protein FtsX [Solirubrobacteraceae bacterium]
MRPGFFLREAFRSVKRNAVPSFAAMVAVLVTVLVLGVFIPIVQATTGAANEVRERVIVDVYLDPKAPDHDVERVRRTLNEDTPYAGNVQYVSKEEAYAAEKKENPEAYELLGTNPLPDTFRVTPDKPQNVNALRDALLDSGGRPLDPAIEEVKDGGGEKDKILLVTRVVKITSAVLTTLLIIASILLVGNTIRLSLFARRREVEVMRLVGATNWFIRWPFVIEGVILGAMGGVLAVLLLLVGKVALVDPLTNTYALFAAPDTIDFRVLGIVLLASSVAVAAAGSGLSLRRFLRV